MDNTAAIIGGVVAVVLIVAVTVIVIVVLVLRSCSGSFSTAKARHVDRTRTHILMFCLPHLILCREQTIGTNQTLELSKFSEATFV